MYRLSAFQVMTPKAVTQRDVPQATAPVPTLPTRTFRDVHGAMDLLASAQRPCGASPSFTRRRRSPGFKPLPAIAISSRPSPCRTPLAMLRVGNRFLQIENLGCD